MGSYAHHDCFEKDYNSPTDLGLGQVLTSGLGGLGSLIQTI